MLKNIIERTSLEAQKKALQYYDPPSFTDDVRLMALGHLSGHEFNLFKACPIAEHYFTQHYQMKIEDAIQDRLNPLPSPRQKVYFDPQ